MSGSLILTLVLTEPWKFCGWLLFMCAFWLRQVEKDGADYWNFDGDVGWDRVDGWMEVYDEEKKHATNCQGMDDEAFLW